MVRPVSFRLLGPVDATVDGQSLNLKGPVGRAVLAALLWAGPPGTSVENLVTAVWGTAQVKLDTVYRFISALRHALGGAAADATIVARRPGYRLVVEPGFVDWRRFEELTRQARQAAQAGEVEAASMQWRAALNLWAGEPLDSIGERLAGPRRQMRAARLAAVEELATLEAAAGRPDQVVELLRHPVEQDPAREGAAALLVEALTLLGRRAEAGQVYRRTRAHMSGHLGLDPLPQLDAAYQASLRTPRQRSTVSAIPPRPGGPIAGLPRPAAHFTGRDRQLADLIAVLTSPGPPGGRVCLIHGMAGIGKTTLAVRAAHALTHEFPDGRLFVDLHGYSPAIDPVPTVEALERLLRRLGVSAGAIPANADDRAALYRDQFTGRRILLVLDDVHDAAQVRPLLPASPSCAVLITSRDRLPSLDEAVGLALQPLTKADAAGLFRATAGAQRLAAEVGTTRTALDQIVAACGRLPLAIRITAARYRTHRHHTLAHLACTLRTEHGRLEALDDGERSITTALSTSYTSLPTTDRHHLLRLALHPTTGLDTHAAAALTGLSARTATQVLDRLAIQHLLEADAAGHYWFHDLTATFAKTRAQIDLPEDDRTAALTRLVDYYLTAAEAADTQITPHRYRIPLVVTHPPTDLPNLNDYQHALAWLSDHDTTLVALCHLAAQNGLDSACWQLAYTLRGYYYLTKHHASWQATHHDALAATRRLHDPYAEAHTLNNLGLAALEIGDHDTAAAHYQQALALFTALGDSHGQHTSQANLAWLHYSQHRYREFLTSIRPVLAFYQRAGSRRQAAITLRGIGLAETALGDTHHAIPHLNQSLTSFTDLGLRLDIAMTLNALGEAHYHAGDLDQAVTTHQHALQAATDCGSTYEHARAHQRLGRLAADRNAAHLARHHWRQALTGYQQLHVPEAAQIRASLAGLPT